LERNCLHKNVGKDLTFAMMITKVEAFLIGSATVQKNTDFVLFAVQATFLPVCTHEPHQTRRKGVFGCFRTSYQFSSQNIDRKILFLKKIKISTRWPTYFSGLFLAKTP